MSARVRTAVLGLVVKPKPLVDYDQSHPHSINNRLAMMEYWMCETPSEKGFLPLSAPEWPAGWPVQWPGISQLVVDNPGQKFVK